MSDKVLFFVMFFSLLFVASCNRTDVGGVYATPAVFDVGEVIDVESIEGNFKIVNTTNRPVPIRNTRLFCGCSKLLLSATTIPPGGFVNAKLVVNVKGRYGVNAFEADVFTEEPTAPIIKLVLNARIMAKYLDGSVFFDLGSFVSGEEIARSFVTLPGGVKSVSVADVRYTPSFFSDSNLSVSVVPTADEKVEVSVNGKIPVYEGDFSLDVELKAEGAFWNNARVKLRGRVYKAVSIPTTVYLGFLSKGDSVDKEVDILCPVTFAEVMIDKIVVVDQLPEILRVELAKKTRPCLLFSLRHSGNAETFSNKVEIEIYLKNGKRYVLSTDVVARFL